jgi:hypothetical protein
MGHQVVANFAHCTMATGELRDEVRGVPRLGVGIRHGEGESNLPHDRHIRDIVADTSAG